MGLIIPNYETPHPLVLPAAYLGLVKEDHMPIRIQVVDDRYFIEFSYRVWKDRESRLADRPALHVVWAHTTVPRDAAFGDPFTRIYDELRSRFPGAQDDI